MLTRLFGAYSRIVIGVWVLLFLGVFLHNTLHFQLYIESWASAVGRFVLPVIASGIFFAAFRLSLESRLILANMLFAVILVLYAGEVYLALRLESFQRSAAQTSGTEFDGRDKLTVIKDLRGKGVDAYPIVRAMNMLLPDEQGQLRPILTANGMPLLPMASLPHTVAVSCNETGQWLIYKTDRHGFNNPDEEWDVPKLAIGLIGDSFAHGSCVPPDQNMAAILRQRFGSVINLGVGRFGPLQELVALTEYLQPLRPRIVLWAFFEGNDLTEDLPLEITSPLLRVYLSDNNFRQDLIHRSGEITESMKAYLDENMAAAMDRVDNPWGNFFRYLSLDRMREAVGLGPIQIGFNEGDLPNELDLFEQILRKAHDRVAGWGGTLYLVYLPESDRYLSRFGDSSLRHAIYQGVKATAQRLGIPMIDVATEFAKDEEPGRFYAYPGSHYNAVGYRVAARAIIEALDRAPR